jgi:hypothetical protein
MARRLTWLALVSLMLALLLGACAGGPTAPAADDQAQDLVKIYKSPT